MTVVPSPLLNCEFQEGWALPVPHVVPGTWPGHEAGTGCLLDKSLSFPLSFRAAQPQGITVKHSGHGGDWPISKTALFTVPSLKVVCQTLEATLPA